MSHAGAPPQDYRGTLNLPSTPFSARAEPGQTEPRVLEKWAELSLGTRMRELRAGAEPFVLTAPPLEVQGSPHVGPALSAVLQDIARKYRHLSGRRCEFPLGSDAVLQRLGVLGSEAEPEEAQRPSASDYVAFRAEPEVAERFPSLKGREVFFITWTRALGSLPGNVALSVNADLEYVFYDAGERVLCVAKDVLARVLAEVKADELVMKNARLPGGDVETVAFDDLRKILVYASGEDLAGLRYQHPLLERTGQVVLGGPSSLEEGTGLVLESPVDGDGRDDVKPFMAWYGAEVLRLWAARREPQGDVPLSDATLEALSQELEKLRHTLAFALGHLSGFEPARDAVPASHLLPLDAWARGRLSEVVARVLEAYEARAFHRVSSELLEYCAVELSATYFALIEDRLLTAKASGRERRSAQTVLFEVTSTLLRLLAPLLSFTAEEAWQQLPGRSADSVFLTDLPRSVGPLDPELAERYSRLLAVRGAVGPLIEETQRNAQLGSSLGARVVLAAAGEARAFLFAHIDELPTLFRVSQVELVDEPEPKMRPLALAQAWPGVELAAEVLPAWGAKCPRCGGFAEEVAQGKDVCPKCRGALG